MLLGKFIENGKGVFLKSLAVDPLLGYFLVPFPVPNYASAIIGASCALNWLVWLLRTQNKLV